MTDGKPILRMSGISKAFPGVQALDRVDLELRPGEILAVVGENGAGKSTLMKILSGLYGMDSGEILFNGEVVQISNPTIAQGLGISCIHQEFNLVPTTSIAENIFIGRLPRTRMGFLKTKELYSKTQRIIDLFGLHLSPQDLASSLSVAEQQVTEILKALAGESKVIIMDEPTSALSFNGAGSCSSSSARCENVECRSSTSRIDCRKYSSSLTASWCCGMERTRAACSFGMPASTP